MTEFHTYDELLRSRTPSAIRHAVHTGRLVRVERGLYVDAPAPPTAGRLAALQRKHPCAVANLVSAAALHGFADTPDLSYVTVPHADTLRPGPGLVVHRSRRDIAVVVRDGVRCTPVIPTVLDLARWCAPTDGLAYADAAVHAGLTTPADLVRRIGRVALLNGAPKARAVIALCERGAESPMESRLRWTLVSGGVPRPRLQHPVTTPAGDFRLDLAWPEHRVCVEYDGWDAHRERQRFQADRRRWRALTKCGWDVHPVTSADMRQPTVLIHAVLDALRARG